MELSTDAYLSKYNIDIYLRDAIKIVLSNKEAHPIKSVYEYLVSVNFGYHVINRDFEYVSLTGRNRISFIRMCRKAFIHIEKDEKNNKLTLKDWHQLATLVCPDFPYEFVNQGGICFSSSLFKNQRKEKKTDNRYESKDESSGRSSSFGSSFGSSFVEPLATGGDSAGAQARRRHL